VLLVPDVGENVQTTHPEFPLTFSIYHHYLKNKEELAYLKAVLENILNKTPQ